MKSTIEEEQGGGRDGGKKRGKGRPRFSSGHLIAAHYCTQDVHGRQKVCPNGGTEANARCRLRSPPRERNTLSGEVERQKVTDDRLLVNPVMALPLTIIIG